MASDRELQAAYHKLRDIFRVQPGITGIGMLSGKLRVYVGSEEAKKALPTNIDGVKISATVCGCSVG